MVGDGAGEVLVLARRQKGRVASPGENAAKSLIDR